MGIIIYEVKDKITTITLKRLEKLNAYNEEIVGELYDPWQNSPKTTRRGRPLSSEPAIARFVRATTPP